jgi:hypothetical protein
MHMLLLIVLSLIIGWADACPIYTVHSDHAMSATVLCGTDPDQRFNCSRCDVVYKYPYSTYTLSTKGSRKWTFIDYGYNAATLARDYCVRMGNVRAIDSTSFTIHKQTTDEQGYLLRDMSYYPIAQSPIDVGDLEGDFKCLYSEILSCTVFQTITCRNFY